MSVIKEVAAATCAETVPPTSRLDIWSRLVGLQVCAETAVVRQRRSRSDLGETLGRIVSGLERRRTTPQAIDLVKANLFNVCSNFTEPRMEQLAYYAPQFRKRASEAYRSANLDIPYAGVLLEKELLDPSQLTIVRNSQWDLMYDIAEAAQAPIVLSIATEGRLWEADGFKPGIVDAVARDRDYATLEAQAAQNSLVA